MGSLMESSGNNGKKKSYSHREFLPAITTTKGYFGLNQLHDYFHRVVHPFSEKNSDTIVVLDFSQVKIWDISCLLWLTIALDYYKKEFETKDRNLKYLLHLPRSKTKMSNLERIEFDKSADYLRRWHFNVALNNITINPDELLTSHQKGYFKGGPRKYYLHAESEPDKILSDLMSRQLIEIFNLADVTNAGKRFIDDDLSLNCRRTFCASGVENILHEQCNLPIDKAKLFSKHLLNEGVLNVQQHPEASIGMVSVSLLGGVRRLVLAMADNGEPITKTIYKHYLKHKRNADPKYAVNLPDKYPDGERSLDAQLRADIITYATQEGTSRKVRKEMDESDNIAQKIGMGLFYIRNDTTDPIDIKGELIIVSDGIGVKYRKPTQDSFVSHDSVRDFKYPWPGNLLRISFPLSKR